MHLALRDAQLLCETTHERVVFYKCLVLLYMKYILMLVFDWVSEEWFLETC